MAANERFEIRQLVRTVHKAWLVVIEEPTSERVARGSFERLCASHPSIYFELVRIETSEQCLMHTANDCEAVA